MRKKYVFILASILTAINLAACLGLEKKELERKISSEESISSSEVFDEKVNFIVSNSNDLSDSQKTRLHEILKSSRQQSNFLKAECFKLKSILMQDVLSVNYNETEVILIRNKLGDLQKRKLNLIFDTIEQINVAMGRNDETQRKLIREIVRDAKFEN